MTSTSLFALLCLFIRATKTHSAPGQPAFSFRLVRPVLLGSQVRQKTVRNLGTDYPNPRSLRPAAVPLTDDLMRGQPAALRGLPVLEAAEELVRWWRAPLPAGPRRAALGRASPRDAYMATALVVAAHATALRHHPGTAGRRPPAFTVEVVPSRRPPLKASRGAARASWLRSPHRVSVELGSSALRPVEEMA